MYSNKAARQAKGVYYTNELICDFIVDWAIDSAAASLLEPSFGNGEFIKSAFKKYRELDNYNPEIYGVEIDNNEYNAFLEKYNIDGFNGNFFEYRCKKEVDAVVGNPPFINIRKIDRKLKFAISDLMHSYGVEMPEVGSLWAPFVIHSAEQVANGGKVGLLLPYELTYTKYSKTVWEYLRNNFGELTLIRIFKDAFPYIQVETVILLASEKGKSTDTVNYYIYEKAEDLKSQNYKSCHRVKIDDIGTGDNPFDVNLIGTETAKLMQRMSQQGKLKSIQNYCKFVMGYISGNNEYFHPDKNTIEKYSIKRENLLPTIINSKTISRQKCIGLDTNSMENYDLLFYPTEDTTDKKYIDYGTSIGVEKQYKCRIREKWYKITFVEKPQIILTALGDLPRLMVNSKDLAVANSLLAGRLKDGVSAKAFACRWYNSLTLLNLEMASHSLGGGALYLIPGEVNELKIISEIPTDKVEYLFNKLDSNTKTNGIESTYQLGDELVLKAVLGLSDGDINEIRSSLEVLRAWRNHKIRRKGRKL